MIITSIKYVIIAISIDNDGEGGILALMSIVAVKKRRRPAIIAIGLFGAALIYGDGAISPAISVLSALEGLNIATPAFQPYVLPIRFAWFGIVFPSLILNYAGQAALLLDGASTADNIFYRLCPEPLLIPLVALATAATIIASQSIITGAFSMTRQAIQLGWLPLLRIVQTSEHGYGQIYVGVVNWLLMLVTVGLALFFEKSDNLVSAYGMAVSATMILTSALMFIAMREIWGWSLLSAGLVAGTSSASTPPSSFRPEHRQDPRRRLHPAGLSEPHLWRHDGMASRFAGGR